MDKEDKKSFIKFIMLLMVGGIVSMLGIGAVIPLIYLLVEPQNIQLFPFLRHFSYIPAVAAATVILISGFWLKNITAYLVLKKQQLFLNHFAAKIRKRLFYSYVHSPYSLHVKRNTSKLINNINIEATQLGAQISAFGTLLNELLTSCFVLAFLLCMNVAFTVLVMSSTFITVKIFMSVMKVKNNYYSKLRQESSRNLIKVINHALGGIKETKIYQKESFFCEQADLHANSLADAQAFFSIYSQSSRYLIESVAITVVLIVLFVFIAIGYTGQQVMLLVSVFGASAIQFLPSMNRFAQALTQVNYNKAVLDNLYHEISHAEEEIKVQGNKTNLVEHAQIPFSHEIRLNHVNYAYSDKKVLRNINLTISKGARVAFVGASGAGKTTLVDIILGILLPASGELLIDSKVVKKNNLISLQRCFGYIPQMIYIYDCSLKENIAFGLSKEQIDEEQVWKSLQQASLKEFVKNECQDGLNTMVGENGIRLSGGQRQRLGIARALYHNPDILVMDEATAALDNQTEKEITQAIENIDKSITIITIAHRLSTIRNYDVIYMLENGEIVTSGSYDNLTRKSQSFKKMTEVANV